MQINEIKQLVELMCNSTLSQLEIEESGTRIKLERNIQGFVQSSGLNLNSVTTNELAPIAGKQLVTEVQVLNESEAINEPVRGSKELKAPMVGTFHFLPNKKIEVGSKLKVGEVSCIIEAMKLMNEISITEAGEIITVEVNEGDMVEYGQVLFTYNSLK